MRNIPVFSTDLGVASLVLDQIPYGATAYVHIHDTACPRDFFTECAQFCRAAGADRVLATGHDQLDAFPLEYEILSMSRPLEGLPDTEANLIPVTEQMLALWLKHYNEKMAGIDGAAYMGTLEGRKLLNEGNGYFVHREGSLMGIGKAAGETVEAIAAVEPGGGQSVLLALCHALAGPMVKLQVASTNQRAIRFYEKMGFIATSARQKWHKIF